MITGDDNDCLLYLYNNSLEVKQNKEIAGQLFMAGQVFGLLAFFTFPSIFICTTTGTPVQGVIMII
jgi:hypothetical protein